MFKSYSKFVRYENVCDIFACISQRYKHFAHDNYLIFSSSSMQCILAWCISLSSSLILFSAASSLTPNISRDRVFSSWLAVKMASRSAISSAFRFFANSLAYLSTQQSEYIDTSQLMEKWSHTKNWPQYAKSWCHILPFSKVGHY